MVRITVQLIDVHTDEHIWQEDYDREVTVENLIGIQSDVAQQVAVELSAVLTPEERAGIQTSPTENTEAYQYYLQGRGYWNRPGYQEPNLEAAQKLYERAIELDPSFALARAALSAVHGVVFWIGYDRTQARMTAQRAEADEALRLQPSLPEAHFAVAYAHYVELDFPGSAEHYSAALKLRPNDAETLKWLGFTYRSLGDWTGAFRAYEMAAELNPLDADLHADLAGNTYKHMRRFPEAIDYMNRGLELAPDYSWAARWKGWTYAAWQGQVDTLRAVLAQTSGESFSYSDYFPFEVALLTRDAEGLLRLIDEMPLPAVVAQSDYWPKPLLSAWANRMLGNEVRASAAFDSAVAVLEPLARQFPLDERMMMGLGFAYAGAGRPDDALRMVERFMAPWEQVGDAYFGPEKAEKAAQILAQAGLSDRACDYLDRLLTEPTRYSVHMIRLDPRFDPISGNPRFQSLLDQYADDVGH
jgi:tetratricopeptide (TPR) repeat protein